MTEPKNKQLPADFPMRIVHVPGWVRAFRTPRHIVRVDVNELGKAGTHGWQVRLKKPSKFFSDCHYGNSKRGNPKASLEAAIDYLSSIYQGPRVLVRTEPTSRKKNPLLGSGVREAWKQSKKKAVRELYIEASPPCHSRSPKRFYVGTENTISPERYLKALAKAREARAQLVQEHLAHQKQRGWV